MCLILRRLATDGMESGKWLITSQLLDAQNASSVRMNDAFVRVTGLDD
jgi:hypothetical protein